MSLLYLRIKVEICHLCNCPVIFLNWVIFWAIYCNIYYLEHIILTFFPLRELTTHKKYKLKKMLLRVCCQSLSSHHKTEENKDSIALTLSSSLVIACKMNKYWNAIKTIIWRHRGWVEGRDFFGWGGGCWVIRPWWNYALT